MIMDNSYVSSALAALTFLLVCCGIERITQAWYNIEWIKRERSEEDDDDAEAWKKG